MHSPNHNQPTQNLTRHLADEEETIALGRKFAAALSPGLVIYLSGDLGAGKTTLVRAMLRGLGYEGKVKSPTYALVEFYAVSSLYLYHFDLYRFADPHEWVDAGFREYFNPTSVCLVEWPEKAGDLLPPPDIRVSLEIRDAGRDAVVEAGTEKGRQCLERLRKQEES
jgi:tRNA threonylcarbamoyladenosine biosynthesis protein TsaE